MSEEHWRERFPEDECLKVVAELSIWTSVDDCLAAARWLEERSLPEDTLSEKLVVPYPDDPEFEVVFVQCIQWLIRSFRVPESKVQLAALLDRKITPQTCTTLMEARFAPDIDQGPPGAIELLFPSLAAHRNERFFVVKDSPHVIELVQNPLRCLLNLINRAWPTATEMRAIREKSVRESGAAPTIFHQPYTDGPLFALIEAVAFYVQGLEIGPNALTEADGINRGYRSSEVIGRPPLDPRLFDIAQKVTQEMFKSLE
jgi:hypothetical protein